MIKMEFVSIALVNERKPFPTIYMVLDPNNLEVCCKIFVQDRQIEQFGGFEFIKKAVGQVLDISQWEEERDISNRAWELYGIISLKKIKISSELKYKN